MISGVDIEDLKGHPQPPTVKPKPPSWIPFSIEEALSPSYQAWLRRKQLEGVHGTEYIIALEAVAPIKEFIDYSKNLNKLYRPIPHGRT